MRDQRGQRYLEGETWVLRYRAPPDEAGRRRRVKVTVGTLSEFPTKALADAAADRILSTACPKRVVPGSTISWPAWCDAFVLRYLPLVRGTTRSTYRSVIETHLRPSFEKYALHELTTPAIQEWISAQVAAGCSDASMRLRYAVLRRMLKRAQLDGLAATLPGPRAIEFARVDRRARLKAHKAWSEEERDALLQAAVEPWLKVLFAVMAFAGLRIGEALALTWQHVDLERRLINVVQSGNSGEVHGTKTAASVRTIPIGEALHELLVWYQGAAPLPEHRYMLDDWWLFPGPTGRPRTASGIRRQYLKPLLERLQIPSRRRSAHAFRHCFAHVLSNAGQHPGAIRDLLGHATLEETNTYIESTPQERASCVSVFKVPKSVFK